MTTAAERSAALRQQADAQRLQLDVRHTRTGVIALPTYKNALIYLNIDEKLKGLFQFNCFLSRAEITRMPPWGSLGGYPRPVKDKDILALKAYYINQHQVEFPVSVLNEAVDHESHSNEYDPVKQYLTTLKWDGKKRVDSWLTDYMIVEPSAFVRYVGIMTLVAACARVDKPGIKYDYMLILEGAQNIGKSMAIQALGGNYYCEISMTERDKDTVEKMQGAWMIEVAELAVFKKRDIESLKAFITCAEDKQRLPYGRRSEIYPRRNIFIGTINPDNNGYLSDSTGNRRFLPVLCQDYIKVNELKRDRDQLFAEAWVLYQEGWPLYIPQGKGEIAQEALRRQANRQSMDEWKDLIEDYLNFKNVDRIRGIDIWTECLKGFASDFDRFRQMRVSDCMAKLGWEKKVIKYEGKSSNGYTKPIVAPAEGEVEAVEKPWLE